MSSKVPSASKQQAIDSLKTMENTLTDFNKKFLKIEENEIRARRKQFESSNVGYYIALAFVGIFYILNLLGTS